jgi:hypothetical protein
MKKLNFISITAIGLVFVSLSGCVSVSIGNSKIEKDLDTKYVAPPKPFVEVSSSDQDKAWRNQKNGNTISFLSECNDPSDPPLEQIQSGIIAEIDNAKTIQNDRVEFNSRDAIHSILDGNVDGIPTRFELMVLKKSNCIFILTYAAVLRDFATNQKQFNAFVKSFVVP